MRLLPALALSSLLVTTALTGCHVSTHKSGDNDNVDIGTPFGSMQVKTNENVEVSGLGITPYPGAKMIKKDKDKDNGAADVNMSFGSFHLGVKAVSYTTADNVDKVLVFYQKDLARYGAVLHCDGKHTVGEPARTAEGLTCDFDGHNNGHMSWNSDRKFDAADKTELRAGSKQHQHIVSVEPRDGETRIGLIALDLSGGPSSTNHKDTD
jgi:hypothetical protein